MLEGGTESAADVHGKDFLALPIGTTVGRYTITAVLGRGGFGITYRAHDSQLKRDVAIKEYLPSALAVRHDGITVLPSSTKAADDFTWGRQRFVDEGSTLASLQRAPAIVRVHDFLEANGTAYIVMELAPGQTLEQRLGGGPLPAAAIDTILWPLLDGLEQVHAAGFLHRDIKPANLLLDDRHHPTLIDFGASRAAIAGRTTAMTAVFTPGYAAAEQMTSAKLGPWTDIYGLSATLYHAITGSAPPSAFDRVFKDACVPLLRSAPAGFTPGILAGIDAGLGVRTEDRPQSIADWRHMLRQTVRPHEPTVSVPRRRNAEPVATPAAPAAAIAPAPAVTPRRRTALWAAIAAAIVLVAGGGYAAKSLFQGPAVQTMTAEELTRVLDERRKADAAALEKKKLEEEAQRRAEADAETRKQADAALAAAQQQKQKEEAELARLRAETETRRLADEEQRKQAALAAQRALDDAAQKNRAEAEIAAQRKADEEAKAKAAEAVAAKQQADEAAQRKAEADTAASRKAEEDARRKAAADAETQRKADEALARAQAERQKADETAAKQKVEADAAAEKKAAEAAETGLKLAPLDRQHLQVALTAAGFDTRGSDGAFGPRSREMIAGWQKAHNQPTTGFLTAAQQQALLKDGAAAIQKYDDDQKKIEDDKKKAEEEAKARAAATPPPPPAAPAPAAPPAQTRAAAGPYDGAYTGYVSATSHAGGFESSPSSLVITNDAGSGTAGSGCGAFSVSVSPTGEIRGKCSGNSAKIDGRVRNGTAQLNIDGQARYSGTLKLGAAMPAPAPTAPAEQTSGAQFDGKWIGKSMRCFPLHLDLSTFGGFTVRAGRIDLSWSGKAGDRRPCPVEIKPDGSFNNPTCAAPTSGKFNGNNFQLHVDVGGEYFCDISGTRQ